MSKTVNGATTNHIWDGANIAADVTNGTVTKYIRGIQLISSKQGNNEIFYNYNGHGDVVQLTSSTGSITKQYSYDAFGVEKNKDEADTNPFRYCGEYLDNESGLIYLRNRYYNSETGRFINEDPIKSGLNWYVYCGGNPVANIDPLGLIYMDSDTLLEGLEEARKKNSVVVHEGEEAVDIYLNIYTHGEMANEIAENGMTYGQAAIKGMIDGWKGDYDYKPVNVIINNLSGALTGPAETAMIQNQTRHMVNGYNVITVEILSGMYWDSKQNAPTNGVAWYESDNKLRPNCMKLYTGGKGYEPISIDYFMQTAGHEIGHELGLVDAYNDNIVGEGTVYENTMPSIMRYQWQVNGAQQIDYYLMMKAQSTNKPQRYGDNFLEITGNGLSWFGYNRIK